jgi:O-acetyl-ADP-ribose deacetylase (regulator of RNase III)
MIDVVKGDLLQMAKSGAFDVIAHGCNCFNTMGAGIAAGVKKIFPEAYDADKRTRSGDIDKLGTCSLAKSKNDDGEVLRIANCYSQYDFGFKNGKAPIDYKALDNCLEEITKGLSGTDFEFGLPMIGYGLAGGKLMPILDIFYNRLKDYNTTIVVYENDDKADQLVAAIQAYMKLRAFMDEKGL